MGMEANSTKKALFKIYSKGHTRKNSRKASRTKRQGSFSSLSSNNVVIVPKFIGCSPGGINSSMQVKYKN
jgi:hypothetical protein